MIVIAHRGSSQLAPENTLPAIKQALHDGVDAIEIDVQLTQDNKVIVIHDEWLNRTTTGSGFVFLTPYARIRRFSMLIPGFTPALKEHMFLSWKKCWRS